PDIPLYWITIWPGLKLNKYDVADGFEKGPLQARSNLSPGHYLRSTDGNTSIVWDPTSIATEDALAVDGHTSWLRLSNALKGAKTAVALINENGEISPSAGTYRTESDWNHIHNPSLTTEFATFSTSTIYNTDWETGFAPFLKTQLRRLYRDGVLADPLLQNNNTAFSYYSVDGLGGHLSHPGGWNALREVQQNLGTNHYATSDFYPVGNDNWDGIRGQHHGLLWVMRSRRLELQESNGADALFSPFVAAGWAANPLYTYRPGRWLGLLKVLGIYGAEFYYTGHFSLSSPENPLPIDRGKHWVWQTLIPSYSQAITSRYETILREGEMLEGSLVVGGFTDFRILSGNFDIYTVGRKWVNPANANPTPSFTVAGDDVQYVFSTTVQPRTNRYAGTGAPNNFDKTADLEPVDDFQAGLQLTSRRQGSTFLLRKDEQTYSEPVMIWLDKWHEPWHTDWWTDDVYLEAEVQDGITQA
ncbi:MAG: hypothetical protein AAGB22_12005, partial [Bacteroidota bacterium]